MGVGLQICVLFYTLKMRQTTELRQTCARQEIVGPVLLAIVLRPHQSNAAIDRQADDDGQVRHCAADGDDNGLDHVAVVAAGAAIAACTHLLRIAVSA